MMNQPMPKNKSKLHQWLREKQCTSSWEPTLFEQTPPADLGPQRFWWYSDMQNQFGDVMFPTLESQYVARRAIEVITPKRYQGKISDDIFAKNIYPTTNHGAPDIELTNFACWALLKRNNHPTMLFSQLFFIDPNTDFQTLMDYTGKYARVIWREKLSEYEDQLNGVLGNMGENPRLFRHDTTPALFNYNDLNIIRTAHCIPDKATLLDYMGPYSLMARCIALDQTLKFADKNPNCGPYDLKHQFTHNLQTEGFNIATTYKINPSNDISAIPVQKLASEFKRKEKEFIDLNMAKFKIKKK